MNDELRNEISNAWDGLKSALLCLGYHQIRRTAQETIIYLPGCRRLGYVPEIGCVVVSIDRGQFPEGRSIEELKQAKAQAIFRAYLGRAVKMFCTGSDVHFSIPAVK